MTTTLDELAALASLSTDARLHEIGEHVPELSLLSLMSSTRDELTHSRMIAALFDPRRHRQAEPALRAFVNAVGLELAPVDAATYAAYERLACSTWSAIRVRRELFRIDIVIEILSPAGSLVIGIENKINAAEGQTQLARYQKSLACAFPEQIAVLAFLAPQKRAPATAHASSRVPAISIDYSSMLAAVSAARTAAMPNTSDYFVLSEMAKHLREDILEDTRVRDLARQLWKDHPRALELAMEHRPRLGDIQHGYEECLRKRFKKDAILTQYPTRGEIREIKLVLQSWMDAGLPFVFMLYADGGPPRIRVLLWSDTFNNNAERLRAWARQVNLVSPGLIDEDFQALSDWKCWRRVFHEDEHPDAAVLQASGFDTETIQEAESCLCALVELLQPFVANDASVR